jgi:hypothetical protein
MRRINTWTKACATFSLCAVLIVGTAPSAQAAPVGPTGRAAAQALQTTASAHAPLTALHTSSKHHKPTFSTEKTRSLNISEDYQPALHFKYASSKTKAKLLNKLRLTSSNSKVLRVTRDHKYATPLKVGKATLTVCIPHVKKTKVKVTVKNYATPSKFWNESCPPGIRYLTTEQKADTKAIASYFLTHQKSSGEGIAMLKVNADGSLATDNNGNFVLQTTGNLKLGSIKSTVMHALEWHDYSLAIEVTSSGVQFTSRYGTATNQFFVLCFWYARNRSEAWADAHGYDRLAPYWFFARGLM